MRRITSIKNAIKYFEENTKVETRKDITGREHIVHIPPVGFHRMNVYEYLYDTKGRRVGTITSIVESFRWGDHAKYLRKNLDKIIKVVVYYE